MCMLMPDSTLDWKSGLDVLCALESTNVILEVATCDMICRMIALHAAGRLNVELDMLNGA